MMAGAARLKRRDLSASATRWTHRKMSSDERLHFAPQGLLARAGLRDKHLSEATTLFRDGASLDLENLLQFLIVNAWRSGEWDIEGIATRLPVHVSSAPVA